MAFVKNFGLQRGAMASSVAHDSHNVIAVGVTDDDLAAAVNAVMDAGGGLRGQPRRRRPLGAAAARGRADGDRHVCTKWPTPTRSSTPR